MKTVVEPFIYPKSNKNSDSMIDKVADAYSNAVLTRVVKNVKSIINVNDFFLDFNALELNGPGKGMKRWMPEMGLSLAYLRSGDTLSAFGQMLVGLSDELKQSNWSLKFTNIKPDILYNSCVYRGCTNISGAENEVISIESLEGVVKYRARSNISTHGISEEHNKNFNSIYILESTGEFGEYQESIWPLSRVVNTDLDCSVFLTTVEEALKLIEMYSPDYYQWVRRAVKGISVFEKDDGTGVFNSSSSSVNPGIITVSMPIGTLSLAETLVHEATHQYFLLLDYCFPSHDGSDANLYFSPVRHEERPLGKILFAFHAVANMAIFYKQMMQCSKYNSLSTKFYNEKKKAAFILAKGLNSTSALTQTGITLRDSLLKRLNE